jgi:adenosylmethionine-8-amino-7-oxononanoate aminotransferase
MEDMDTKKAEKKFFYRSESPLDIEVEKVDGNYIYSADGKKYLDLVMGWCVGNLGWGNQQIREAIHTYNGPDYVYPQMRYSGWTELSSLLAAITPGDLEVSFRTTGGSESVDTAMQIAMAYTGRRKFVSIEDSYHGNTLGPLSIGASSNRENIEMLLPNCNKIDKPLNETTISKVETQLKKGDVAAFIMEPVLCNLGVHIPTMEFMHELRRLCTKYGTLLVIDEVATGFGRTGKTFAIEHFKVEPDIMCLGKAVTGGYAPMGATVTTHKIAARIHDKVNIYSTYGWHPVSVHVALSCINYFLKHKISLLEEVSKTSQLFRTRLSQMSFKEHGELNIIGHAISVNVGKTSYADNICKKCRDKGLLITSQESQLVMFPALTIGQKTATEAMDILEECI